MGGWYCLCAYAYACALFTEVFYNPPCCRLINDSGHTVSEWSIKNISSVILSPSYASKGILCQFNHGLRLLWWWLAGLAAGETVKSGKNWREIGYIMCMCFWCTYIHHY